VFQTGVCVKGVSAKNVNHMETGQNGNKPLAGNPTGDCLPKGNLDDNTLKEMWFGPGKRSGLDIVRGDFYRSRVSGY
jgi:hypothetical protein